MDDSVQTGLADLLDHLDLLTRALSSSIGDLSLWNRDEEADFVGFAEELLGNEDIDEFYELPTRILLAGNIHIEGVRPITFLPDLRQESHRL